MKCVYTRNQIKNDTECKAKPFDLYVKITRHGGGITA